MMIKKNLTHRRYIKYEDYWEYSEQNG